MGAREDAAAIDVPLLDFAAKRLERESLIVVSNISARKALAAYRERWAIECVRPACADLWRSGPNCRRQNPNIEDTHITQPQKLALLMALVALAIA